MGRGVDTASLALMRRGDLVGMTEGCWTRAQSGDCLSVQPVPLGFYPWVGISKEYAWPLTFSPTFVLTLSLSLWLIHVLFFAIHSLIYYSHVPSLTSITHVLHSPYCHSMLHLAHLLLCTVTLFAQFISLRLWSNPLWRERSRAGGRDTEWKIEYRGEGVVALHWTHLPDVFPCCGAWCCTMTRWAPLWCSPLCCCFIELGPISSTARTIMPPMCLSHASPLSSFTFYMSFHSKQCTC